MFVSIETKGNIPASSSIGFNSYSFLKSLYIWFEKTPLGATKQETSSEMVEFFLV